MSALPTKRIYYDLDGVTRIEAYCDAHFLTYEKNKDTDINDIMEAYGCARAPPDSFGRGKKGYPDKVKSISEPVTLCRKCGYVRIYWIEGDKIPYEIQNKGAS